jgi:DNA-binding beta-propeller fold protein YncE
VDPEVVRVERGEDKAVKEVVISSSGIIFTLKKVGGKVRVISRSTFRRTTFVPKHEYSALIAKANAIFADT